MKVSKIINELRALQQVKGADVEVIMVTPEEIMYAELSRRKKIKLHTVPITPDEPQTPQRKPRRKPKEPWFLPVDGG